MPWTFYLIWLTTLALAGVALYSCTEAASVEDEPEAIAQFPPGERQSQFDAEWDDEKRDWIYGKRVDDA
jgi:hypothetical protein